MIENLQPAGPIGALIALLVAFYDSFDRSRPSPRYAMIPLWEWYHTNVALRVPPIGLVSLILVLAFIFSGYVELMRISVSLVTLMVFLLLISWILYDVEHSAPFSRRTTRGLFGGL